MYISAVYIRFFRSFNYDYLRKAHPEFEPYPWDTLSDGTQYPFVEVSLEQGVTTVVGANESGKSQLLLAIECALTGRDIQLSDFCRYSQFFAVDETMSAPDFGLKLAGVTDADRSALQKAFKAKSPHVEDRFCLFRIAGQSPVIYMPEDGEWRQTSLRNDNALDGILPSAFRIDSEVALPNSVPIRYLIEGKYNAFHSAPRSYRQRFVRTVISQASAWWPHAGSQPSESNPAAEAFHEANRPLAGYMAQLELADKLIFTIAGINRKAFEQLWSAVESDDDGYANSIVAAMNQKLADKLNFPKWWSQDHSFQLLLTLRDHDLVLTVRDRTGTEYSAGERSTGLRFFLSYFIQYLAHEKPQDGLTEILLMDEPDAYLSSAGQQDLLRIFEDFADPEDPQRDPCQVVYVTHSPFLIDKNHGERIRVLDKGEGEEGTRVVRNAAQNHYEPLRSAFGSFVAETTFISNCNLMVEGQADQVLLAGMAARLRRADPDSPANLNLNTVTIVPAGGATNVPYLVYLARGRDVDKPAVIVLLDSDAEGNGAADELRSGVQGKRLLNADFVVQLGTIGNGKVTSENPGGVVAIEDLIPLDVTIEAVKRYGRSFLAPDQVQAVNDFTVADVDFSGRNGIHDAVERAVAAKVPGFRLAKIGLARCVMEVVRESELPGVNEVDANFRAVFEDLGKLQRRAMREFTTDQIERKIKRLNRSFLLDHPDTATKAQVDLHLEDIEASLDNSVDADSVRAQIATTKRALHLEGTPGDAVDHARLRGELDKLTYKAVNDVQV